MVHFVIFAKKRIEYILHCCYRNETSAWEPIGDLTAKIEIKKTTKYMKTMKNSMGFIFILLNSTIHINLFSVFCVEQAMRKNSNHSFSLYSGVSPFFFCCFRFNSNFVWMDLLSFKYSFVGCVLSKCTGI